MEKRGTGDVINHHGGRMALECQVCWKQWGFPFINGGSVPDNWDLCPKGCTLADLPEHGRDWLKRWNEEPEHHG